MCETRSVCYIKWRFREKQVKRMGQKQKVKTETATGLGRRTREEI